MNTRDAVLGFHYAERTKSHLILIHRLLEVTVNLPPEQGPGASRLLMTCLENVRAELCTGKDVAPHIQWDLALQLLHRIREALQSSDLQEARHLLSRCLSSVTTMSQRAMEILLERGIL